jgi:predicted ester cyclase
MRRWSDEVWNKANLSAIEETLPACHTTQGLSFAQHEPNEIETFLAYRKKFGEDFSALKIVVEDAIADGDRAAARCIADVPQAGMGKPCEDYRHVFRPSQGRQDLQGLEQFRLR